MTSNPIATTDLESAVPDVGKTVTVDGLDGFVQHVVERLLASHLPGGSLIFANYRDDVPGQYSPEPTGQLRFGRAAKLSEILVCF